MGLRRPLAALALASLPALALAFAAAAWGEPAAADAPSATKRGDSGAPRHDPDNKTALAEWMEKCIQGNAKFISHDVPGAIDLYRQAIQLAPKRPLPHYLLGEAQLGAGNLDAAEAAIKDAEQASDDRDPDVRAKILFVLADLRERQKKWDDAKAAWKVYADYAEKHADAGMAPPTPVARIQAIDDMLKQDKAYEVVRQRIADAIKNPQLLATPDAGPSKAPKKK